MSFSVFFCASLAPKEYSYRYECRTAFTLYRYKKSSRISGKKTYIYTFIVTPKLGFSVTMSNYNIKTTCKLKKIRNNR